MRKHLIHTCLIFVVLAGALAAPPQTSGGQPLPPAAVRVVSSDRDGFTLELTVPGVTAQSATLAGRRYDVLSVPGLTPATEPGLPALPRQNVLLGVPPDADLEVASTVLESETLPGTYRVAPAPRWVPRQVGDVQQLEPVYTSDEAAAPARLEAEYPAQSARLVQDGYVRSQRVVSLELTPFQYRPASGELRLIRRLQVRLGFHYANPPAQGTARPEDPAFETALSRTLLNYEAARTWRTTPVRVGKGLEQWSPPSPAWKVLVNRTDLYRLGYANLQTAGLPVDTLDPRTLRLYIQGTEVAIRVVGEEDGHLNTSDCLEFYGQGLDTRYTDTNVYWLTCGGVGGLRMTTRDGTPTSAPTVTTFTTTAQIQENHEYWSSVPTGDDHWFWGRMYAISPTYSPTHPLTAVFTGTIGLVATDTLTCTVGVFLQGATYNESVNPDHHALVYLNDHPIADAWWEGQTPYSTTVELSQAYLTDITNTFRVDMPADTGSIYDGIYVNRFTVQYTQPSRAQGDELAFTQGLSGTWQFRITDFSEPNVQVFDVTDPTRVVRIIEPPPTATPALVIEKVDSPDPVPAGGVLSYTLTVRNVGSAAATNVVVTDGMPAHTAFHYASDGGTLVGDEVRWTGLTVGISESLDVRFSVTVDDALPDGSVLTNGDYGVWCTEGVSATGSTVTTTVTSAPHYQVFLPVVHGNYAGVAATPSTKSITYGRRFQDTVAGPTKYLALASSRAARPLAIVPDVPSNLADPTNKANYVFIAYDDFYTSTLPLAAYWQSQGMTTTVVRISDVYDEFSQGIVNPTAIRDFLAYAYANWQAPQVAYVLLVGTGTYDYRNYLGFNPVQGIPPYLVPAPTLGETGSDNWYACVSGADYLPDLYIGRLPAATVAEADRMVGKILNYAQNPPAGTWKQDVLFVADDADAAGNFPAYSDALANGHLPPAYTPHKVYYLVTHMTQSAATSAIINTVNDGCVFVNYMGHGAIYLWAAERLLFCYGSARCDFDSMVNGGKLPFVVAMTCMDGYYIEPNPAWVPLAKRWLACEGGGAVATFSATGYGLAPGHQVLDRGLFTAIFTDTQALGPATLQAKIYLNAQTGDAYRDLVETYHLFGDPALALQHP